MANTRSAEKRTRQIKRRTAANRVVTSRMKATRKQMQAQIEAGELDAAADSGKKYASFVDRAAKKGVIHANKASNLKSKASAALKKASAAS